MQVRELVIRCIKAGDFAWASTATLLGTAVVTETVDGRFQYNPAAFAEDGLLRDGMINVQDPTNANCGSCHGVVHTDLSTPLTLTELQTGDWSTLTTGQVMSPQRAAQLRSEPGRQRHALPLVGHSPGAGG